MIAAWLRGMLTPDYPMGVQSIVRENILLEALDKEQHGQHFLKMANLDVAMLPLLNQMGVRQTYSRAGNMIQTGSALLRNLDSATIQRSMRKLTMSSPEEAVAAFELLKSTPIFDELQATLRAADDEGLLTPGTMA